MYQRLLLRGCSGKHLHGHLIMSAQGPEDSHVVIGYPYTSSFCSGAVLANTCMGDSS